MSKTSTSSRGRLWAVLNESAITNRDAGDPLCDISFSDQFLLRGWPKVASNARDAIALIPRDVLGGVFLYNPHGLWREHTNTFEKRMDAVKTIRNVVDGYTVRTRQDFPLEVRYQLEQIASLRAYTGALFQIRAPLMIYLGYEDPNLAHEPNEDDLDQLHLLLRKEITAAAMRSRRIASRAEDNLTYVAIDGLTERPEKQWIMHPMREWGVNPCTEGLLQAGEQPVTATGTGVTPAYVVGEWLNFVNTGGAQEGRRGWLWRSLVIYREDQGATPAAAIEALRAGIDVGMVIMSSEGPRPEAMEVIRWLEAQK